jgi:hypothetical protein
MPWPRFAAAIHLSEQSALWTSDPRLNYWLQCKSLVEGNLLWAEVCEAKVAGTVWAQ